MLSNKQRLIKGKSFVTLPIVSTVHNSEQGLGEGSTSLMQQCGHDHCCTAFLQSPVRVQHGCLKSFFAQSFHKLTWQGH